MMSSNACGQWGTPPPTVLCVHHPLSSLSSFLTSSFLPFPGDSRVQPWMPWPHGDLVQTQIWFGGIWGGTCESTNAQTSKRITARSCYGAGSEPTVCLKAPESSRWNQTFLALNLSSATHELYTAPKWRCIICLCRDFLGCVMGIITDLPCGVFRKIEWDNLQKLEAKCLNKHEPLLFLLEKQGGRGLFRSVKCRNLGISETWSSLSLSSSLSIEMPSIL